MRPTGRMPLLPRHSRPPVAALFGLPVGRRREHRRSFRMLIILILPAASHSDSHQRNQCGHDGPCLAREAAGRRHVGRRPEPCSNRLIVPDTEVVTA